MIKFNKSIVYEVFFIILTIILGLALINVALPFLQIIVIALIIVMFYHPFYNFMFKRLKVKALASLISCIFVFITMFIPASIIIAVSAQETLEIRDNLITSIKDSDVLTESQQNSIKEEINQFLGVVGLMKTNQQSLRSVLEKSVVEDTSITEEQKKELLTQIDNTLPAVNSGTNDSSTLDLTSIDLIELIKNRQIVDLLIQVIPSIISGFANFLFQLFILLIIMFFMFIEYENLPEYVSKYSPFINSVDKLLFTKFIQTSKTVIKSTVIVAAIQATSILIPLTILNVPAPMFWWVIMFILSIIPVGAGLVSIPIGIFLIVSSQYTGNNTVLPGIFLIVYSIISINLVDNIIRPLLSKKGTGLHPLVSLISGIGGIIVFASPLGLLYGQLIAVFYKTLIEVFQQRYPPEINEAK